MRANPPPWYDESNVKRCDHDTNEYEPTRLRSTTGYSDFGYFKSKCGHPVCEETWCWYVEG